jgi:hypothetical protein
MWCTAAGACSPAAFCCRPLDNRGEHVENQARMSAPRRLFVGRERELEELASGFDEAAAGRGALFLLVGAAGIGKTRLCDEAARAGEARGMRSVWGRCWETGGAPAYWPFIQVLRELCRGPEGATLIAGLGPRSQALAALLPELVPVPPASDSNGLTAGEPVEARFRLFEAAVDLLRRYAERTPLVVVLDDLHVADPSSLALLHFLARNLRGLRVLVIGAYRDEDARFAPEVSRALTDVAREGAYLPLPPLGRVDIAALVASAGGASNDAAVVTAIERATEGNPLFLSELLRLMAARGDLERAPPAGGAVPLPDTVREVIGRRIARLTAPTRTVLASASVVGRDFSTSLLAAITGQGAADLERHLGEAEHVGLVLGAGTGDFRFSHVLVREALYRKIDPGDRALAHLRVAAALEASPRAGAQVAEIAHHRLAALPAGEAATAAATARRAADRAMTMLAFEDAALLLARARAALEATPPADLHLLCELRLLEGVAHLRAGDGERGRAACVSAADEARRLQAGELLARAALGYGAELMLAQTDARLVALLEEALTVLPAGPSGWRAQVMARLAAALQPAADVEVPMQLARKAIAMARGIGDPAVLRMVLLFGGAALADYAPGAERAAVSEELVRLATAAGDRFQVLRAQSRLVFDYLDRAAMERSHHALDAYDTVAREFGQARHSWPGRLMRSMLLSARGRFDDAGRLHEEAVVLAEGDTDRPTPFVLAWAGVGLALNSGRPEDLTTAAQMMRALLTDPDLPSYPVVFGHLALAALHARMDDAEGTRRHLGAIDVDGHVFRVDSAANAHLAEALALLDDRPAAARVHARLLPAAGRILSTGRAGMSCYGPADLALGVLAVTDRRFDVAARHLEAAIATADLAELAPCAVQARYWLARLFSMRDGAGDHQQAERLAAQARDRAAALGMPAIERRLARLQEERPPAVVSPSLDQAPPPPLAAGWRPTFSFIRQGEYWTVATGDELCRLKDSKGVGMLAELCAHPGREFHVLSLSGAVGGDEVDGGDAGEVLDAEAVAEYRARLEELDEQLREAQQFGDQLREARARSEREAIAHELARGVGLGGRARRAGSAAERARVNVQRRIRGAIRRIGESLPALGAYLERTVRTGTYCVYQPL